METSDDKYPRLTRILSKSCPFSTQGLYPWEPGGVFSSIVQFKRTTINPFQSSSIHVCYLRDFTSIYIPGFESSRSEWWAFSLFLVAEWVQFLLIYILNLSIYLVVYWEICAKLALLSCGASSF